MDNICRSCRYSLRANTNGYWTVCYTATGEPVVIDNIVMDALEIGEADRLLELLSEECFNRRKGPTL